MVERLSDADVEMVADALVDFSRYIFGFGDDHTEGYLSRMSKPAKRDYLKRCDDVLVIWRAAAAKRRGDLDINL